MDSNNNLGNFQSSSQTPPSPPFYYKPSAKRTNGFWNIAKKIFLILFALTSVCGFALMLLFILGLTGIIISLSSSTNSEETVTEKVLSGSSISPKKIVILPIEGTITENEEGFIRNAIRTAYEDNRLAGIVLRINSPGGTIAGSDYYYQLLRDLKETREVPIFVSMGGIAASGGYYVSMVGDKIFAERSTLTGSIGVIGMLFDASELCDRIGLTSNYIVSGPNKGMGDFTKPMSDDEREIWQGLINDSYEQFLSVVREGRPCFADESEEGAKPVKELREIADGRIYSASEAKELGLVDELGFLHDAVEEMIDHLGVSDEEVEVVRYKKTAGLLDLVSAETEGNSTSVSIQSILKTVTSPSLYYLPGGTFPMTNK